MEVEKIYSTDEEGREILNYIFRDYLDFYKKLAPEGWKYSSYVHFFHPTPQQQIEESKGFTDGMNRLRALRGKPPLEHLVDEAYILDDVFDVNETDEFLYVLGLAVYDIFSNNHSVMSPDEKEYDFGSFRGTGDFIADYFNNTFQELSKGYDYLDFYMGSFRIESRADMKPFYEYVFTKLKKQGLDWVYSFPRLYFIRPQYDDATQDNNPEDYDPHQAVFQELQVTEKNKKINELNDSLNDIYDNEYEEAKYKPLIPIVQAYKNVYGVLPDGHPQKE